MNDAAYRTIFNALMRIYRRRVEKGLIAPIEVEQEESEETVAAA